MAKEDSRISVLMEESPLKKKARKYFEFLVIRRPTLRLLAQIAYKGDPMKVLNLRVDSLAQLLCQGRMLL